MNTSVQEIVFAFLQTYYQRMGKDPSKVSSLYSLTAELTHVNYQVDFDVNAEILPTIKITGKENISKFFTRNNKKVSDLRVLVETCDFQTTGSSHSSILILTTGVMFWTGTPIYKFAQTIILTPNPSNKDCFDVTNDVIRFIPDNLLLCPSGESKQLNGDKEKSEEKPISLEIKKTGETGELEASNDEESKSTTAHDTPKKSVSTESKEATDISNPESRAVEKEDPKPSEERAVDSAKAESSVENSVKVEKILEKTVSETDAQKMADHPEPLPTKEKAPALSNTTGPVRMSWASKLAANGDVLKASTQPLSSADSTRAESSLNGHKKSTEMRPVDLSSRRENISNRTTKKKQVFSTINKDGFYPIYIKGTAGITDDKLKSVLEFEFGTVMKMTTSDSFAVVDFETQKSQIEALERKQLVVGDNEIFFGRKTVKKPVASPPIGPSTSLRSHKKHNASNNTNNTKRKD